MTKNKKQNREQKKEKKNHTWKENEVCLLFPNFKPASNQTKIQFFKNYFIIKHIKKTNFFWKEKKRKKKKCIKNENRQNKNRKKKTLKKIKFLKKN